MGTYEARGVVQGQEGGAAIDVQMCSREGLTIFGSERGQRRGQEGFEELSGWKGEEGVER